MTKFNIVLGFLISVVFSLITCGAFGATQTVDQAYPGLTSGALASAELTTLPAGTLLHAGSIKITQKELDSEIAAAPLELRPKLKANAFFLLESKATKELITAEAKDWAAKNNLKSGKTETELLQTYFESLIGKISVTDEEAKSFYDANKDMVGTASFDQVKNQIKDYVLDQKRQIMLDEHIKSIGNRISIEVDKDWVAKQYATAMDNPVDKARKSGKSSIVDFGADGCRPCEMMTPILDALKKEYEGKANVLFVHVRKEQVLAERYGIESIPVQVFFDKDGKEVFRHVGFFPKEEIVAKLAEMGVK